jgi:hypothetical protein
MQGHELGSGRIEVKLSAALKLVGCTVLETSTEMTLKENRADADSKTVNYEP